MTENHGGIIYSPQQNIPIGEPSTTEDGKPALKVKYKTKHNNTKVEVIPLDYIYSQIINAGKRCDAQSRSDAQ